MHQEILKDFLEDNNLNRVLKKYNLSPHEFLKIKKNNKDFIKTFKKSTKSTKSTTPKIDQNKILIFLKNNPTVDTAKHFNITENTVKKICTANNIKYKQHNKEIYKIQYYPILNGQCIMEFSKESNQPLLKVIKILNFIDPYTCRTHYNKYKKKVIRHIRKHKLSVSDASKLFGITPTTIRNYFKDFKTTYNKYVFEDYYYPKVLEYMENNFETLKSACKHFDVYPISFRNYLKSINFDLSTFSKNITNKKYVHYLTVMVENEWNFATTAKHFNININTIMMHANNLNFNYSEYRIDTIKNKLSTCEGLKNYEIAEKLNISLNTVKHWKNKVEI